MRVVGLAVALVLVTYAPVLAVTPTDEIREIFAEVNRILTDPATEDQPIERLRGVLEILERVFAFDEAAELALGRDWHARTAPEREEFLVFFADFVERSFVLTVTAKAELRAGVEIRYLGESVTKGAASVLTTMVARDGNQIRVEFRMVERGDRWAIRDVVLEGVSLSGTYRAQFTRVLRAGSFADLVARLRARAIDVPDWWSAARPNGGRPVAPVAPLAPVASVAAPPEATAGATGPAVPVADPSPEIVTSTVAGDAAERKEPLAPDLPRMPPPTVVARTPSVPVSTASVRALPTNHAEPHATDTDRAPAAEAAVPGPPPRDPEPRRFAQAATVDPPAPPRATYWIQVGLFLHPNAATRLVEDLLKRTLPVEIAPVDLKASQPDVRWTRVRVGPFADRVTAAAALRELERRGYAPFLATEPPAPVSP